MDKWKKDVFKDWNVSNEKIEFIIDTYNELLKNNSEYITSRFKEYVSKYNCNQWDLSFWCQYFHEEVTLSLFFNSILREIREEFDKQDKDRLKNRK